MNSILFTLYMNSNYTLNHSRCKGCLWNIPNNNTDKMIIMKLATLNQLITKSVGQSSSQYLGNLGSLEVLNWRDTNCNKIYQVSQASQASLASLASQASDRYYKAKVPKTTIIPNRGNSTKRTQTSLRPGALGPGGTGVDVKHNSYARYLAKKKGKTILGNNKPAKLKNFKHTINNKFMKPKVVAGGISC